MGGWDGPGFSPWMARTLSPHAHVYGTDIDTTIPFQEDRIKTFYCDQLDEVSIRTLWSQTDWQAGMDIIQGWILSLRTAYTHLKPMSHFLKARSIISVRAGFTSSKRAYPVDADTHQG